MDVSPPHVHARWAGRLVPGVVFVAYLGLAASAFAPTAPLDNTRLPNGPFGDPLQMVWFLAWTPFALLHGHDPFFTSALDYPNGVNLASNTSVPLLGVLGAPLTYLFGPVATFNVLLRLGLALSAISTYAVLGRWCRSKTARFVAGLIFGFGPYLAAHTATEGHLNLVFLPIPPLLAWCFDAAFGDDGHHPVRIGVLTGVLCTAQLLISPEVLSDAAIVGAVVLVVVAVGHRDLARARARRSMLVVGSTVATFGILGAWPLTEMLAGRRHLSGPVASVRHLQSFHVDLLEPILPTVRQLIAPGFAARAAATASAPVTNAGGGAELGAYLGLPLVIIGITVVIWRRRDAVVQAFALVGGTAFLASLGGRLTIGGHTTPIRLPEALLGHLPLLRDTVPARFSFLVAFAAAGLLALGADRALATTRASIGPVHRRARVITVAGVGALVLIPLLPAGAFATESPAVGNGVAAALSSTIPRGTIVLAYPYADPPFTEAMAWQAIDQDRFSMIGGYATVPTTKGTGATFAPLLTPPTVQEFLATAETGRARHYPASSAPSLAELCSFVDSYRVGAVLFDPAWPDGGTAGPGVGNVAALFARGFGHPQTIGGIEIWRSGDGGICRLG